MDISESQSFIFLYGMKKQSGNENPLGKVQPCKSPNDLQTTCLILHSDLFDIGFSLSSRSGPRVEAGVSAGVLLAADPAILLVRLTSCKDGVAL